MKPATKAELQLVADAIAAFDGHGEAHALARVAIDAFVAARAEDDRAVRINNAIRSDRRVEFGQRRVIAARLRDGRLQVRMCASGRWRTTKAGEVVPVWDGPKCCDVVKGG